MSNKEPLLPNFYTRSENKIMGPNGCCRVPSQASSRGSSNQPRVVLPKRNDLNTESSAKTSPVIKSEPIESRAPIALYEKLPVLASPPVTRTPSVYSSSSRASTTSSCDKQEAEETKPTPALKSRFIEDVNVPDGTALPSQAQFLKIWKMENSGEIDWPETTVLQFTGGKWMFNEVLQEQTAPKFPVGKVEIGKTIPVTADLQAPAEPGRYVSYWRLTDGQGNLFGDKVWVEIIVENTDASSSLSSSMVFPRLGYEQSFQSSTPSVVPESQIAENEQIIAEQSEKAEQIENPFKDPDHESTASLSESFSETDSEFIVVESSEHQIPTDNAPSTTCNVEVVSETASQHSAQEFVDELQKLKELVRQNAMSSYFFFFTK
jgi:hypothetical protein